MTKKICFTLVFLIFSFTSYAQNLTLKVNYKNPPSCSPSFNSSCNKNPSFFSNDKPLILAVTCMKKGEKVSGMNKICYYDCLGSGAAITISSTSLCPLTIRR